VPGQVLDHAIFLTRCQQFHFLAEIKQAGLEQIELVGLT
jgi:hypothetical protein